MKEDESGWGGKFGAPAAKIWHCPKCDHNSFVSNWQKGEGDTRACPQCAHVFTPDKVETIDGKLIVVPGTARSISEADIAGKVKRDR